MLKSNEFKRELEAIEDYDSFYDNPDNNLDTKEKEEKTDQEEEDMLLRHF